jgi:hypothetical protein
MMLSNMMTIFNKRRREQMSVGMVNTGSNLEGVNHLLALPTCTFTYTHNVLQLGLLFGPDNHRCPNQMKIGSPAALVNVLMLKPATFVRVSERPIYMRTNGCQKSTNPTPHPIHDRDVWGLHHYDRRAPHTHHHHHRHHVEASN